MGVRELHGVMTSRVVVLVGRGEGLKGGRSVELQGGGNGGMVMAQVCARVEKIFPFYSHGNEGSSQSSRAHKVASAARGHKNVAGHWPERHECIRAWVERRSFVGGGDLVGTGQRILAWASGPSWMLIGQERGSW